MSRQARMARIVSTRVGMDIYNGAAVEESFEDLDSTVMPDEDSDDNESNLEAFNNESDESIRMSFTLQNEQNQTATRERFVLPCRDYSDEETSDPHKSEDPHEIRERSSSSESRNHSEHYDSSKKVEHCISEGSSRSNSPVKRSKSPGNQSLDRKLRSISPGKTSRSPSPRINETEDEFKSVEDWFAENTKKDSNDEKQENPDDPFKVRSYLPDNTGVPEHPEGKQKKKDSKKPKSKKASQKGVQTPKSQSSPIQQEEWVTLKNSKPKYRLSESQSDDENEKISPAKPSKHPSKQSKPIYQTNAKESGDGCAVHKSDPVVKPPKGILKHSKPKNKSGVGNTVQKDKLPAKPLKGILKPKSSFGETNETNNQDYNDNEERRFDKTYRPNPIDLDSFHAWLESMEGPRDMHDVSNRYNITDFGYADQQYYKKMFQQKSKKKKNSAKKVSVETLQERILNFTNNFTDQFGPRTENSPKEAWTSSQQPGPRVKLLTEHVPFEIMKEDVLNSWRSTPFQKNKNQEKVISVPSSSTLSNYITSLEDIDE